MVLYRIYAQYLHDFADYLYFYLKEMINTHANRILKYILLYKSVCIQCIQGSGLKLHIESWALQSTFCMILKIKQKDKPSKHQVLAALDK